jgi:hypothetical protein
MAGLDPAICVLREITGSSPVMTNLGAVTTQLLVILTKVRSSSSAPVVHCAMRSLHVCSALMLLCLSSLPVCSADRIYWDVLCDKARIVGARGVIGPEHTYQFAGSCELVQMRIPSDERLRAALLKEGKSGMRDKTIAVFNVTATARWERRSGYARERAVFAGAIAANVVADSSCVTDPFLDSSKPSMCEPFRYRLAGETGAHVGAFRTAIHSKRLPLFDGRVDVAEAQALSAVASSSPPPPPPPPPKAKPRPALKSTNKQPNVLKAPQLLPDVP